MKDLETIKNTQIVIENLANGVNIFTGEMAKDDDIINDVKISRCLFYVNELLKDLMNDSMEPKKQKRIRKSAFVYDEAIVSKVTIEQRGISLSQIAMNITVAYEGKCKVVFNDLASLLYKKGILIDHDAKTPKLKAAPAAKELGIWSELIHASSGDRLQTFYNENGQRYVLSILQELNVSE